MTEARRILAEGKFVRLVAEGSWEWAERVGASGVVVIIPITPEGELVLVEQYRKPLKARVLEIPAGLAGDIAGSEDEAFEAAAHRELEEETGFRAGRMEFLTAGPSSAGASNSIMQLYLATELTRVGKGGGDEHEDITVHVVPLAGAEAFIEKKAKAGCLPDPKLFAGLYFAQRWSSQR